MNATHNKTGQRLQVITRNANGDLTVTNRNGTKFNIPANLVTIHTEKSAR